MKKFAFVLAALLSGSALADDAETASYACMMRTKAGLHDPDSAKFPEWQRSYTKKNEKTGLWRVQVEFQARNGFNALRKGVSECGVMINAKGDARVLSAKQIR